jgi:hypothetical protein
MVPRCSDDLARTRFNIFWDSGTFFGLYLFIERPCVPPRPGKRKRAEARFGAVRHEEETACRDRSSYYSYYCRRASCCSILVVAPVCIGIALAAAESHDSDSGWHVTAVMWNRWPVKLAARMPPLFWDPPAGGTDTLWRSNPPRTFRR